MTRIRFRAECIIDRDRRMPTWKQHTITEYADSREELRERIDELQQAYRTVEVVNVTSFETTPILS